MSEVTNIRTWVDWDICSRHGSAISRVCTMELHDEERLVVVRGKWSCDICHAQTRAERFVNGIGRIDDAVTGETHSDVAGATLNAFDVIEDDNRLLQNALDDEYRRVARDFPDQLPPLGGES